MKTHRLLTTLLAIAVAAPTVADAQEEQRQRERQRQAEEQSRRQVERAREALEAAIRALDQSRTEEYQEALRRAVEAAREAQRDIRSDQLRGLIDRIYVTGPERNLVIAGTMNRPRMGVILESSSRRSDTDSVGAVLQAVTPGGPADEAGLKAGDIVISANGMRLGRIERGDDAPDDKLVAQIRELEEGETLSVVYRRGEETGTADVVVRVLGPANYSFSFSGDSVLRREFELAAPNISYRYRTGESPETVFEPGVAWTSPEGVLAWRFGLDWAHMELVTLDEDLGGYFGTTEGLLVVRAPKADDTPLRSGDIILRIGDRVPTNASHVMRIMRSYDPGETMHIEIMRNRQRQTIEVTVPERDRGFFWSEPK
jgi:C-terminal processing protease CtpA/Prc